MNSDLGALISPQMQHGDLLSSKVVDSAECLRTKQGVDHNAYHKISRLNMRQVF
jgi:hypothetical protein